MSFAALYTSTSRSVLPDAVAAQEGVEAVAAAQQVGGVVGDEVLVVETSHEIPGFPKLDGVVYPDLDVGVAGQGVEQRVAFHAQEGAEPIHQQAHLHPTFSGVQQGCQQVGACLVGTEVEGGQDELLLGVGDHL